MIDLTCRNALESGVENRVKANIGDMHQLAFPDNTFGCVMALGVTPWLADLNAALREINRVLVPGGYTIINGDNRFRLNNLLDPALMPALAGLKEKLKRLLEKRGLRKPSNEPRCYMYTIKEFNHALASAGLAASKHCMLGFGPFSFLKYQLFPNSVGVRLHHFLQHFADKGSAVLRSTGSQFLVLAKKT
jgi:SAM-dependent methyltransferase